MRWAYAVTGRRVVIDRGTRRQIHSPSRKYAPTGDFPRTVVLVSRSIALPVISGPSRGAAEPTESRTLKDVIVLQTTLPHFVRDACFPPGYRSESLRRHQRSPPADRPRQARQRCARTVRLEPPD